MEETRFEKMWFLSTADYFGTYFEKGKFKVKEKGIFKSNTDLGKGMEFPIIATAVRNYFLKDVALEDTIYAEKSILPFLAYKRVSKVASCFHNDKKQQRINRYYAVNSGAYLYRSETNEKTGKVSIKHILKDSPVAILNKLDDVAIDKRNLNYRFYLSKARDIVFAIEGNKLQTKLF